MARPKGSKVAKRKPSETMPKKKCIGVCGKEKTMSSQYYYLSNSEYHMDRFHPVCKECLKAKLDVNNLDSVYELLRELNRPFFYDRWISAQEEALRRNHDPFGLYLKNVMLNDKGYGWKDSIFESNDEHIKEREKALPNYKEKFSVTDEIIDKWGEGYSSEEYRAFERKYYALRNNYQEKTAMHTEALITYIRYRVKEELATAKGDAKEAKDWGNLAKEAATAAKINPSQLSKADLSDGLDGFGQLVRAVEQAVDIIPILPKFKERPQDKVDFTIWCYVNYIRDLKGLPLATYQEIYDFYEQRKKEYEQSSIQGDEDEFI